MKAHLENLTFPPTDGEVLAGLEAAESDAVDDDDRHCDSFEPPAGHQMSVRREDNVSCVCTDGLRVILIHCLRRGLFRSRYFSEVGAN